MNMLWVLLAVAVSGITAMLRGSSLWRVQKADLGFVSRQWVDEHRQSQAQDSNR